MIFKKHYNKPTPSIFPILLFSTLLHLTLQSIQQPTQNSMYYKNKNTYKLQQHYILSILSSSNVKIVLQNNSIQKSHTISTSIRRGISDGDNQSNSNNNKSQWNIVVNIKILLGNAKFYFTYIDGFANNVNGIGNLRQQRVQQKQWQNNATYCRQHLQLKQGINTINYTKFKYYLQNQPSRQKYLQGPFAIIGIVKQDTKFVMYYGNLQFKTNVIKYEHNMSISVRKDQVNKKHVYLLNNQDEFRIQIIRKKGFPSVYIYECMKSNAMCYQNSRVVPLIGKKSISSSSAISQYMYKPKYALQSMLTKSQQFICSKCPTCSLYLVVQPNQLPQQEIMVLIQPVSYTTQLKQNQIHHYDIVMQETKKYKIKVDNQENIRVNVQVYQGQIQVVIKNKDKDWTYIPTQSTGIISFQIPYSQHSEKNTGIVQYDIEIKAKGIKDATYSIAYSSGRYQIYIKDGYPTSHQIKPKQNISFLYYNQDIKDTPMYLSFNLNNSKAQNSLKMHIYYYFGNKGQKSQYILPTKTSQQLPIETKLFLVQIPGKYPKLEVVFENVWNQTIQIAVTINDEEIIFLPLYHSLPLQVQKNGGVNLLINNNQEGFIQLTIKKCDQSYPNIAYSLSPQDFMKKIYDYESLGQNQRIVKSNIKVKKDQGLYIRISGDGMSNSFIQVSASYMQVEAKKLASNNIVKKGNHGQISYQLITNSKAQIWFNQIQCSQECQKNTTYECYWSTSKSDLFRHMVCPGSFIYGNSYVNQKQIKTQGYIIQAKPGRDGIISFKHTLSDPIIYMNIKAQNKQLGTQLIYKDFQIVTFSGQLGRMSTQFLFISIGTAALFTLILFLIIRRQARLGYSAINTSQNQKRKKKTKLDMIQAR